MMTEIETSETKVKEEPKQNTVPESEIEKKENKVSVTESEVSGEKQVETERIVAQEKLHEPEEIGKVVAETVAATVEEKQVEEVVVSVKKQKEQKTVEEIKLKEKLERAPSTRLGDKFSKEKSVNDLINVDNTKLEHKLSNRPVEKIKTAIGINDRFLYIRELFDGNADNFSRAIAELDNKKELGEAVEYLQQNFKWEKNETSLKFVNLVKRRFANG